MTTARPSSVTASRVHREFRACLRDGASIPGAVTQRKKENYGCGEARWGSARKLAAPRANKNIRSRHHLSEGSPGSGAAVDLSSASADRVGEGAAGLRA